MIGGMRNVPAGVKCASLSARVIRADGSTLDLGVISYYHRNALKRWGGKLIYWLRSLI